MTKIGNVEHVLHIVRDIDVASGGPSRSVTLLSECLVANGVQSSILFVDSSNPKAETSESRLLPLTSASKKRVCEAVAALHDEEKISVIHSHGCWSMINHYALTKSRQLRIPNIISPRGMLEPWSLSQKRLRKKIGWLLYQGIDFKKCDGIHATGEMEKENLLALGIKSPICVVPNGIEAPTLIPAKSADNGPRIALFLSRIHPKKGLVTLVRAWKQIKPEGWQLRIVGPDENQHASQIQSEIDSLELRGDIDIEPAVDGNERWIEYRNASLFILPTFSENFGNVVGEALACRTPVITTTGTPWRDLETSKCGWWVDPTVESIAQALRTATSLGSEELKDMGLAGEALYLSRYTWPKVVDQMKSFYSQVIRN